MKNCQIFTPRKIVNKMLDEIGFKGEHIIGKTICDLSCGDGAFLSEILNRIIKECKNKELPNEEIAKICNESIYGCEIDLEVYIKCINKLNAIVEKKLNLNILWKNIITANGLLSFEGRKFDFVVGNPPYISYADLEDKERSFLKEKFKTCSFNKFDCYFGFIEKSLYHINENGLVAIIAPINMFKTKSGKIIREFIKNSLVEIIDLSQEKVFKGVLVNTVISIYKKTNDGKIRFVVNNKITTHSSEFVLNKLCNINNSGKHRFGDFFKVSCSVATLNNDVFVVDSETCNRNNFEKDLLFNATSPRIVKSKSDFKILFPYRIVKDNYQRISEDEFLIKYPNIYNYLIINKNKLLDCDRDRHSSWFEYGRSQGIKNVGKHQVLISAIFTHSLFVSTLKEKDVAIAGYTIKILDEESFGLKELKRILKSDELFNYLKSVGVKMSGGSYRFSNFDLENFMFDYE